ncbi:MAG: hypothetical protein J7497_17315, partial [Chitinophagaceae bacterium]|nr:hypothetical protein [Chitinophagaceae bacterium]
MKKIIVLIAYAIVPFGATSQSILTVTDIPYLSGAQFSSEFATAVSFNGNPAVFPPASGFGFGMYSEKKFMTEGLNTLVLSAGIFRERSAFGIGLHYFGDPEYNEMTPRINYSRSMGRINIGVGLSYTILSIAGFPKQSAPGITLSCTWKLSENIYAGL